MRKQRRIDLQVQHVGDDLRPTMHEVVLAVGDCEVAGGLLGLRPAHETQFAAIVQLPDDTVGGKRASPVRGEPGVSLPMPVALMTTLPGGNPNKISSLRFGTLFCIN